MKSKTTVSLMGMTVRLARRRDLLELVELEQLVWLGTGVPTYVLAHFCTWLKINPACFLVAEYQGKIVGYSYQQRINFSLADVSKFVSHEEATDCGYTLKTHLDSGNSFYGVSIVSVKVGAGIILDREMYKLGQRLGLRYYLGFPRLAGFDRYMRGLERNWQWDALTKELEAEIALWYAIKCVEMAGGKIWSVCPPALARPLYWPKPSRPDPVLNWHLKNKEFGLAGVVSNYLPDLSSRNYAAFNIFEFPTF